MLAPPGTAVASEVRPEVGVISFQVRKELHAFARASAHPDFGGALKTPT